MTPPLEQCKMAYDIYRKVRNEPFQCMDHPELIPHGFHHALRMNSIIESYRRGPSGTRLKRMYMRVWNLTPYGEKIAKWYAKTEFGEEI